MIVKAAPYIMFNGNCREALDFYKKELGATDINLMTFKGTPIEAEMKGHEDKIMHGQFKLAGVEFFVSDGDMMRPGRPVEFQGFHISVTYDTPAEAERIFAILAKGGEITMPIEATFWAPRFGALKDKFGMKWFVSCEHGHK